ncbi:MAG: hypothetical protein ACREQF_06395, partial [Candidatus Binataceae bacterium]
AMAGSESGRGSFALLGLLGIIGVLHVLRRRRVVRQLLLLSSLWAVGCTSQPLEKCVVGWWKNPVAGACLCPPQAECTHGDCTSIGFIGFQESGLYYSGNVSWSDKGRSMSTEGSALIHPLIFRSTPSHA